MAETEPWANPPKSHLRWPAMLFGFFGASMGLLIVIVGVYALLDYQSSTQIVPIDGPAKPAHPEDFVRSSGSDQRSDRILLDAVASAESPAKAESNEEPVESPDGSAADMAERHAKSKQRTFVRQGREATRLLETCDAEVKLWSEQITPLLDNEAGKRLAGDKLLVRQFRAIYVQDRPSSELIGDLRTSVDDLVVPVKEALEDQDDHTIPNQSAFEELQSLQEEARKLRDALRTPRERLVALAESATSLPMQDVSLRQALNDVHRADMLAETSRIEAEVAEANRIAREQKAQTEAQIVRDKAAREIEKRKAEAEHDRLVEKAKTAEVQQLLAPFITKGYYQYRNGIMRDAEPGPFSYTGLKGYGALNPTTQGLTRLNELAHDGGDLAPGNDRQGLWKFANYPGGWSATDQEYMKRVQDLLRELGPTLVELKMLAP